VWQSFVEVWRPVGLDTSALRYMTVTPEAMSPALHDPGSTEDRDHNTCTYSYSVRNILI